MAVRKIGLIASSVTPPTWYELTPGIDGLFHEMRIVFIDKHQHWQHGLGIHGTHGIQSIAVRPAHVDDNHVRVDTADSIKQILSMASQSDGKSYHQCLELGKQLPLRGFRRTLPQEFFIRPSCPYHQG